MAAQALRKFVPLFNRVLVEKAISVAKTKSGIVVPESSAAKSVFLGKVLSVGPGFRKQTGEYVKPIVEVGDTVLLPEYGGTPVKFNDKEYMIYHDMDLLGKFDGDVIKEAELAGGPAFGTPPAGAAEDV